MTLRDPVDRAWSHYRMVTSEDGTEAQRKVRGVAWRGKTFGEVVEEEMGSEEVKALVENDSDENYGRYLKTCPMNTGSHSLIVRGMYELQLRPWLRAFDVKDVLVVKMEDMKRDGMQPTMDRVYDLLDLPQYEVKDEGAKNSREGRRESIPEDVKEKLRALYEKFDKKLFEKLGWEERW